MTNIFEDQEKFMILGRQNVDSTHHGQAARYIDHLLEESGETVNAFDVYDPVQTIDGLIDSIVVAAGGLISLIGAERAKRAWDIVMDANMAKVDGRNGPIRWRGDGQVGKPEGWAGPEIELRKLCVDAGLIEK